MNAIEKRVRVKCSPNHAFEVFTRRIDMWWPPHHRTLRDSTLALEGRAGGRFYEQRSDGTVRELGHVLDWVPPERLSYAWYLGTSAELPTRVDVRFIEEGEHTLVEVLHSEDQSLGGAWPSKARRYDAAWEDVLATFETTIAQQETDS